MIQGPGNPRQSLWRSTAAALVLAVLSACAATPQSTSQSTQQMAMADPKPGDGLGGTGITQQQVVARTRGVGDGIGGTGILGTISGFGSIIVNGKTLEYDRDTKVEVDGRPSVLEELKIGQVVQGVARMRGDTLYLDTLEMQHAVTGPIERIDHDQETLTVLGQTVRANLSGDKAAIDLFKTLTVGDMVSVSGLRQADGTIIATRIDQQQKDGRMIVRGTATLIGTTAMKIGGLEIPLGTSTTLAPVSDGGRAFVSGRVINGQFVPDVIVGTRALPFDETVKDISIEAYAPTANNMSPLVIDGITLEGATLPSETATGDRLVISGQISGADRVTAASIEKIRTFVTVLRARGSLRPAAVRPDRNRRLERMAPPLRPITPERPTPERPDRERPGGGPMV